MRLLTLFGGLAFTVAVGAAAPAQACMVLAPMDADGRGPSAREIRAQMESARRARLRRRTAEVETALAGGVDPGAELATMLVPNIRPIPTQESDCGPVREFDGAFDRLQFEDYLRGTYLAGHADALVFDLYSYEGELFGPACNDELRARFADTLRRRLDDRQRRAAYLFLGARWGGREPGLLRIMRFRDWRVRRPPVDWSTSYPDDILGWLRDTDEGRAMQAAIDDFWRESGPLLGDNRLACPATVRRWPEMQSRLVAEIETQNPTVTAQLRRARRP